MSCQPRGSAATSIGAILYNGDDVVGLLDFDDVDRGPYAYDIAAGVVKFGREGRGSFRLRPSFARQFLDGDESVRALSAEERLGRARARSDGISTSRSAILLVA